MVTVAPGTVIRVSSTLEAALTPKIVDEAATKINELLSILKEMADRDERFEDTEICCLITDGEEAGLRGATTFANENAEELMAINMLAKAGKIF